ncbi:MAG: manganese efflux pump [Sedimentisphaerales bacterium]|nr:manganese efflux pump [Sedimentisphaerales bacterium]
MIELATIVTIAIALAMDAFAVSIVSGSAYRRLHIGYALRIALFFGVFQAVMPLIGSLAGLTLKDYISAYDHWVAFGLLFGVGAKMIYESFKITEAEKRFDPTSMMTLLALSVATSIDALAVGITLSLITSSVAVAVIIIGVVTFVLSYIGVEIGKRFGHFFESKMEITGGVILIAIGAKILIEHILASSR